MTRAEGAHFEAVRANVERFTVRPAKTHTNGANGSSGVNGSAASSIEHDVVIGLLDRDLSEAFARAKEVLAEKKRVRLIGHGVTIRSTWPSWVETAEGLTLSELGSYRVGNVQDITRPLREMYRSWVGRVFERAAPKGEAADLYFAPVVARLFHPAFEAQVFVGGIAALHQGATFHLVGDDRSAYDPFVPSDVPSALRLARDLALPPALVGAWLAATAVTLKECVVMRLEARPSWKVLDARPAPTGESPRLWVGVVPDCYRNNKHIIDAAAIPELEGGRKLGVLFLATLRSGRRGDLDYTKVFDKDDLWAGLGVLRPELDRCEVAQAVMPRKLGGYLRAVGSYLGQSASVIARMAMDPEPLRAVARRSGVYSVATRAAAVASLDVARSVIAEHAAREVVAQRDFGGRVVVLAAATASGFTSVDSVLKSAGATTAEHTHGSTGNVWYGAAESSATVQIVWTEADKGAIGGVRPCEVGGMPQVMKLRARTPVVPRKVLLLTNYVTGMRFYKPLPFEPFQDEVLRAAKLLNDATGGELSFRWRPHPVDEDEPVARGLAKVPFIELSRTRPLEEDLDWCDVLVTVASTAMVEAALGDVPIFVHALPEFEPEFSFMPPERRFFRAEEFLAKFQAYVEAVRRGDPAASAADARGKVGLFGKTGRPRTVHEAFGLEGTTEQHVRAAD